MSCKLVTTVDFGLKLTGKSRFDQTRIVVGKNFDDASLR